MFAAAKITGPVKLHFELVKTCFFATGTNNAPQITIASHKN
jgi:hypothetical protein